MTASVLSKGRDACYGQRDENNRRRNNSGERLVDSTGGPIEREYFDHKFGTMVHKINEGGFCVLSRSDHLIMTTLGSCISVCMHDPVIKVGGMNHFILPSAEGPKAENNLSMRYGNNAMELLLNEILKRGGQKQRLIIKAFGAGNVLDIKAEVGAINQHFLTRYMSNEGLSLTSQDLGGKLPRWVIFFPETGRVFVKKLRRKGDRIIGQREEEFCHNIKLSSVSGDVEIFKRGSS